MPLAASICSSFSRSSQRLLPVFSTDHMEYYSLQAVAVAGTPSREDAEAEVDEDPYTEFKLDDRVMRAYQPG